MQKNDRISVLAGIAALAFAFTLSTNVVAQSRIPVSIELVLAVDTSLSVDEVEYNLQMTGIARAFRDPDILALIKQHAGVAVTLFQWSTSIDERHMIGWHILNSAESVYAFAAKVDRLERDPVHGFTGIGNAIDFGVRLIDRNGFDGRQLKIDISGDGRNNSGILPVVSQRGAQAHNIAINGLPILIDTFNLDTYFRENVIHGPGAFVEIATDYEDFAQAFLRKLTRELTPTISGPGISPKPGHRNASINMIGPDPR